MTLKRRIAAAAILIVIAWFALANSGSSLRAQTPGGKRARAGVAVEGSPVDAAHQHAFATRGVPNGDSLITVVQPDPAASGDQLTLEQAIADQFPLNDLRPPGRTAHFQWLNQQPVTLIGWRGLITDISANADGSWNITVNFTADLSAESNAMTITPDYYVEHYNYSSSGQLTFLGGLDPSDSAPSSIDTY